MTDTPTPEAIVKAALERAAEADVKYPSNESLEYQNGWDHAGLAIQEAILTLASDQAEVAQIIQNAGGQTDPYLYAVGYDVGFEDGFKEAQGRVKELEADIKGLRHMILDQINSTGDDPEIMAATRAEWAARALTAEAKVAEALEAVKSIKSDMDDRDDNSAYLTCKYIIAKLEGDSDD